MDLLTPYISDINNVKILPKEEQYKILSDIHEYKKILATETNEAKLKIVQKQYEEASTKIVQCHYKLVLILSKRYYHRNFSKNDFISEGNIGLMIAIEKYDITRGYEFITYAKWWIEQRISKFVTEHSNAVVQPSMMVFDSNKIKSARVSYYNKYNKLPSNKFISKQLNISEKRIFNLMNMGHADSGMDGLKADTLKYLSDNDNTQSKLNVESFKNTINALLNTLSDREQKLIKMRFGLNGYSPTVLKDIGKELGISKERTRQIQLEIFKKLKPVGIELGLNSDLHIA